MVALTPFSQNFGVSKLKIHAYSKRRVENKAVVDNRLPAPSPNDHSRNNFLPRRVVALQVAGATARRYAIKASVLADLIRSTPECASIPPPIDAKAAPERERETNIARAQKASVMVLVK